MTMGALDAWVSRIFAFILFYLLCQVQSAFVVIDVAPVSLKRTLSSTPLCVFHNVNQCVMSEDMLNFFYSQPLCSFSMRNPGEEQHVLNFASLLHKRQLKGTFGASSVRSVDQVEQLIDCGVQFFSTMHLIAPIVDLCRKRNFPVLCGVHSLQDVQEAVSLGVELYKFYPVSTISEKETKEMQHYIRTYKPHAVILASGGVTASNAGLFVSDYGFDNVAIGLDLSKESFATCQAPISATTKVVYTSKSLMRNDRCNKQ